MSSICVIEGFCISDELGELLLSHYTIVSIRVDEGIINDTERRLHYSEIITKNVLSISCVKYWSVTYDRNCEAAHVCVEVEVL